MFIRFCFCFCNKHDKRKKTNICSLFQIVCPTPHPSVIPFHNQTVWIPFKVDQIPEKEDFGIAKALASILKLIETVIMDTAFAEGPPNGRLPSTSDDADILENGNMETKIGSQESFTELMAQNLPQKSGPVIHRRADRHYSKRMRRRLVYKNGEVNITQTNIRKRRRRYLADIFTTLVDIKWRYNLLLFALAFILSWLIFAVIWWLISFSHGDLENSNNPKWKPCVKEMHTFTSALLFSIETQHTIGYGARHTTEECPEAITVMMIQSCFGVICQAMMTGIVFAKLSRPKKRAETLMFSKNACICQQDGDLCLLIRVGDMRKSHLVEAHVRAVVIKRKITKEGEVLPLYQFDVDLGYNEGRDRLFLVWPVILVHRINEESPFWEMSPEDLHREQFELIVILEGIVESTGMTTQARSSYLPGEILWGHRFERLVTFQKENGQYQIDFSRFHNTLPMETPQCSAKELAEMGDRGHHNLAVDDDEEITSIGSTKNDKFPSPYVIKRHGFAQTDFDYDEDDLISQESSVQSRQTNESETLL